VELVGWTYSKFINPVDINSVVDIQTLHDVLRSGACHWVQLSAQKLQDHLAEVEVWHEWGEVVHKKHKECSDKGVKRKCNTTMDENNPEARGQGT
jgi:hypothetical protein